MLSSCLGILHGYTGTFSRREVEHVFTVPLSWFASHAPRICDGAMAVDLAEDFPYELIPGGRDYPWHRIPRRFYFYESEGGVIWGITAELLYHALGVLIGHPAGSRPGSGVSAAGRRRHEPQADIPGLPENGGDDDPGVPSRGTGFFGAPDQPAEVPGGRDPGERREGICQSCAARRGSPYNRPDRAGAPQGYGGRKAR